MGKIQPPEPAFLFIGTLYSRSEIFDEVKTLLENDFGEILFISPSMPWDYSSYYRNELGWPIFRRFIFFKDILDPCAIADIKLHTNSIEEMLSVNGRRSINLDPGYLSLAKVVLASTKNYAHRIYLGKGIYGEVTLMYQNNTYNPYLFTYRDYQGKEYIDLFLRIREYLEKK
jgi:hypothetical protein